VAKPSRHHIRRGGFVLLQIIHLKQQTYDGTLDLIEMRRQLTALDRNTRTTF
jgi:hypothetical protein